MFFSKGSDSSAEGSKASPAEAVRRRLANAQLKQLLNELSKLREAIEEVDAHCLERQPPH